MCCRYWADESPELRAIVEEMNRSPLVGRFHETTGIRTCGEIRPADVVPVIAPDRSGARAVFPMKWGFRGKSLLLNARTETAASRPAFRESWQRRRCIVPASWYFEWEHPAGSSPEQTGSAAERAAGGASGAPGARADRRGTRSVPAQKYIIQPKGSSMTWLCGLYRIEEGLPVFVILTREAGGEIRFIHDRMPLLPERCIDAWIRPDGRPEELIGEALTEMIFEKTE